MKFFPLLAPVPPGAVTFVLDTAVAFRWCVTDMRDEYPGVILHRMPRSIAAVPNHWYAQLGELFRGAVRSKRLTEVKALDFLAGYDDFQIRFDPSTAHYLSVTFALARKHKLPVFDAAYIELALRLVVPLATNDPNLTRVANAVGVPIFSP